MEMIEEKRTVKKEFDDERRRNGKIRGRLGQWFEWRIRIIGLKQWRRQSKAGEDKKKQ